jgi:hypothetical protein
MNENNETSSMSARQALSEITRSDVLVAIKEYGENSVAHRFEGSTTYDLVFDGNLYPPKAIAGLAARRLLGRVPGPDEFQGGLNTSSFRALERTGFTIVAKGTSSPVPEAERISRAAARGAEAMLEGSGFSSDAESRRAVELHAMSLATEHYKVLGYQVEDCSNSRSYDLHCTKSDETIHVEVKGSTTSAQDVIFTLNEVTLARDPSVRVALFVVGDIKVEKLGAERKAKGGTVRIFDPWTAPAEALTAISYRCRLPK